MPACGRLSTGVSSSWANRTWQQQLRDMRGFCTDARSCWMQLLQSQQPRAKRADCSVLLVAAAAALLVLYLAWHAQGAIQHRQCSD